jgi:hypothetical protein
LNAIIPDLCRASYSWKKYPAFLTADDCQIFPALEVLSQKIRTRFGQPQLIILKKFVGRGDYKSPYFCTPETLTQGRYTIRYEFEKDKIPKGAKPKDRPVKQPTKWRSSSISKPPNKSACPAIGAVPIGEVIS